MNPGWFREVVHDRDPNRLAALELEHGCWQIHRVPRRDAVTLLDDVRMPSPIPPRSRLGLRCTSSRMSRALGASYATNPGDGFT